MQVVTCPVEGCQKTSTTFDPAMYLSLPLPVTAEKSVEVRSRFPHELQIVRWAENAVSHCYLDAMHTPLLLCKAPACSSRPSGSARQLMEEEGEETSALAHCELVCHFV